MSVSSSLKDNYNNPISNIELLQRNNDDEGDKSNATKFFLRTGRPGHLFLKPNYSAFTKTNLGSIPSRLEKTLIKTETNKPMSTFINNTLSSFKKKKNLKPVITEEKDIRKYTTSFSSKGFGVGFVSKVSRFGESLSGYEPGPTDYYPDKNFTLLSKVEKSNFGKSFFKKKTSMSLTNFNTNLSPQSTMRSSTTSKNKNNTEININDSLKNSDNQKLSYYFNSTSDRFNGGIFGPKNKNPGPGKYFFDNNNILIKDPEKLSSEFILPQKKMVNPIKYYGLNKNEKKKFKYLLSNKNRNGKIKYFWKGLGFNKNDEILLKSKKFNKSNFSLENNSTKLTSVMTNNNMSNLPSLYFGDKKNKINCSKTEYISISPENSSWVNGFEESTIKNSKIANNIKKMLKFKKKNYFSLSSPRWDQGYFHDNATHFQVPGPAYYAPKLQNTKKSFNLNNKDFIYTNSLPFKNDEYYTTSSVLI